MTYLHEIPVLQRSPRNAVASDGRTVGRAGVFQHPPLGFSPKTGVQRREPWVGHSHDELPLPSDGTASECSVGTSAYDNFIEVPEVETGACRQGSMALEREKQVRPEGRFSPIAGLGLLFPCRRLVDACRHCCLHHSAPPGLHLYHKDPTGARGVGVGNALAVFRAAARSQTFAYIPVASMAALDTSLRELGPYTVVRTLGRGGMGIVYEAIHRKLGKRVALKVLHPQNAGDPRAWARFAREARAAAQLRHPHVVSVLDAGQHDGQAYLVMELVEGPTLEQRLRDHGPLSPSAAVDIFLPIASAVCAAHEAGIVHRDLKPGNVILARSRSGAFGPVVVDFGISKVIDEQDFATRSEAILGTLPYLAPELTRNAGAASPASDQYALGVMLYECTTGRRPFSGASPYELLHAIVMTSAPPPSSVNPKLPGDFDALVARAMAREAQQRHASVQALASALLSFGSRRAWALWGCEFAALPARPDDCPADTSSELDSGASVETRSRPVFANNRAVAGKLAMALAIGAGLGAAAVGFSHRTSAADTSAGATPPAVTNLPTAQRDEPALTTASGVPAPVVEAPPASVVLSTPRATPPGKPSELLRAPGATPPSAQWSVPAEHPSTQDRSGPTEEPSTMTLGANQAPIIR